MRQISFAADQAIIRASRSKYFFYLVLSLPYVMVAYLLQNPVQFRWVTVGVIIFLLFAATVGSMRKGMVAIFIFLPFMAFLRRALYFVSPYEKYDPIHLVVPALVLLMFVEVLLFNKERLLGALRRNNLAKYVIALLGVFCLQIFNPLQESLLVGLGGALYYVIPMVWFFLALSFADGQFVRKLTDTIVVIGLVTSAYGLCQMVFGFLPFETYWIKHGGFVSLQVGRFIRPFSTFSNPEEYSRYLVVAGIIAFGYFLKRKNPVWLASFIFLSLSVIMSGVRSSVFGLAFGVSIVLVVWRVKDLRKAFVRLVVLASAFVVIMSFLSPPRPESVYRSQSVFYTMAGHTTRGFVNPLNERTFQGRLSLWKRLLTDVVPRNPIGHGLGSASIAAQKFGGSGFVTEGYLFALFINSGVVGGLLFLIISVVVLRRGTELSVHSEGAKPVAPFVFAIIASLTLNNIFGSSFVLYSVAPIGWFLFGWISKGKCLAEE